MLTSITKRAMARPAPDMPLAAGPALRDRIGGLVREIAPRDPDLLEEAGWSELLESATSGVVTFDGGTLFVSPTPAMTLIDVDGWLPAAELACAAAGAAARVVRCWGIGGSIGIDFPTLASRAERLAVDRGTTLQR